MYKIKKKHYDFCESDARAGIVFQIENIWKRARHNAFAHKIAAEEAERKGRKYYTWEIICSFLSILLIIITYAFTSTDTSNIVIKKYIPIITTVLSVVFTLIALLLSILSNYRKFDIKHAEHLNQLGSYQHIAQKARKAKWKYIPYDELLRDFLSMEESFQLLKVRGREPSDSQFDRGVEIFKKISENEYTKKAQSFPLPNETLPPSKPPHATSRKSIKNFKRPDNRWIKHVKKRNNPKA